MEPKKLDFNTFVNGISNDLKESIDNLVGVIIKIREDVDQLKQVINK